MEDSFFIEYYLRKHNIHLDYLTDTQVDVISSVLYYITKNLPFKSPRMIESITPEASLRFLFEGNRRNFAQAFVDISLHWGINNLNDDEIPENNEFERFPEVIDLITFFMKKVEI